MAFAPGRDRYDVVVWDIETDEVAVYPLTEDLASYIVNAMRFFEDGMIKDRDPFAIHLQKMVWHSPSELRIQYFENRLYPVRVYASLRLNVAERPLQLALLNSPDPINRAVMPDAPLSRSEVDAPFSTTIAAPASSFAIQFALSPDPKTAGMGGFDIRVYDPQTDTEVFVATSTPEVQIQTEPFWLPDGSYFFYEEDVPAGKKLALLNVQQGFVRDLRLDSALEAQFGTSTGGPGTIPALLSPDGISIGFGYIDQRNNDQYVIRYNIVTGEAIAVCDEGIASDLHAFWSPSSRFLATQDAQRSGIKVYDFETGNRYMLPGNGFAGWIP